MSIKAKLSAMVVLLCVLSFGFAGWLTYQEWGRYQQFSSLGELNGVVADLMSSSSRLAAERGLTQTYLKQPSHLTPVIRSRILNNRDAGETSLKEAINRTTSFASVPEVAKAIEQLRSKASVVEQFRGQVDQAIKTKAATVPETLSTGWYTAMSDYIQAERGVWEAIRHQVNVTLDGQVAERFGIRTAL